MKTTKTSILFFFSLLFTAISTNILHAESLNENEAKDAATRFLLNGNDNSLTKAKIRSGQYLTLAAGNQNGYYVFNRQDGGMIVVADDDALGRSVIGYTTEGAYDPEALPIGLQEWFDQISVLMSAVHAGDFDRYTSMDSQQGTIIVDALIKTKWNQRGPYNNLCPLIKGQRCLTGCVATAMAQVFNYWKWPEHGYGTKTYTTTTTGQELSIDFSNSYYDWDNMLNEYDTWNINYSERQATAVATLMRDCGYGAFMDYGLESSGGYITEQTLINHFNYSPLSEYVSRNSYFEKEWHEILQNELNNKRPVLYRGSSETGGHQFILDGYDTNDFYHVNWGWGGYMDGWFILTDLNSYNTDQAAVIGVEPVKNLIPNYREEAFSYTLSDDVLTINGVGSMPQEYALENAPWRNQCQTIKKIIIGEGIISTTNSFGYYYNQYQGSSYYFENLEEVVLPEGMLIIDQNFVCFSPLQRINLPSTLQTLKNGLWYCDSLNSLHLPKSLKSISCTGLSGLEEITIDEANPYFMVKDNALLNKEGTKLILTVNATKKSIIPESVTEISEDAFSGNQASIIIARPMEAPTLPEWGFYLSKQTGILYIKKGATGYDTWLSRMPEGWIIKTYTDESQIPSGEFGWTLVDGELTISGIGELPYNYNVRPFAEKSSEITKIKIEEGVMSLGWATFWGFHATKEVELPSTMKKIESQVFGYSGINKIVCLAKTAPQITTNFVGLPESGVLQVLEGCDYSTWLAAMPEGWTIEYIKHPLLGKITNLSNYILGITAEGLNTKELDANKDGKFSITDITRMISQLNE